MLRRQAAGHTALQGFTTLAVMIAPADAGKSKRCRLEASLSCCMIGCLHVPALHFAPVTGKLLAFCAATCLPVNVLPGTEPPTIISCIPPAIGEYSQMQQIRICMHLFLTVPPYMGLIYTNNDKFSHLSCAVLSHFPSGVAIGLQVHQNESNFPQEPMFQQQCRKPVGHLLRGLLGWQTCLALPPEKEATAKIAATCHRSAFRLFVLIDNTATSSWRRLSHQQCKAGASHHDGVTIGCEVSSETARCTQDEMACCVPAA